MIDLKVTSVEEKDGKSAHIVCHMEGSGIELLNETLTVIQSLMGQLKEDAPLMHLMAVQAIADDTAILFGKRTDDIEGANEARAMADLMSGSIIKKGVN